MASQILESVTNDINKARKESAKAKVKKLIEDLDKANAVVEGIIDNIVAELVAVGEDETEVRAALTTAQD